MKLKKIGRGERIRTSDPLHPMQVRYQAALRPDRCGESSYQHTFLKRAALHGSHAVHHHAGIDALVNAQSVFNGLGVRLASQ
jgi:hypothetical protein